MTRLWRNWKVIRQRQKQKRTFFWFPHFFWWCLPQLQVGKAVNLYYDRIAGQTATPSTSSSRPSEDATKKRPAAPAPIFEAWPMVIAGPNYVNIRAMSSGFSKRKGDHHPVFGQKNQKDPVSLSMLYSGTKLQTVSMCCFCKLSTTSCAVRDL